MESIVDSITDIYYAGEYVTAYSLFSLYPTFNKSSSINLLLDYDLDSINTNLLHNNEEEVLNLNLDRKMKVDKVIKFLKDKSEIRKGSIGNQNLLIIVKGGETTCYTLTPLNLDSVSLGTIPSKFPVIINEIKDKDNQYLQLFKRNWNSSAEIKKDLITHLIDLNEYQTPSRTYKSILKEIFDFSDLDERLDSKLNKIGFKESVVWNLLYNFQKDAVVGAINKIETYGGCIIADSVGLGKTFEALAVMKYYQLRNDRILVLAPKKLRENWSIYQLNANRNIL